MPTSDSGNTPPPIGKESSSNDYDPYHPPNNRLIRWWLLCRSSVSLLGRGLWITNPDHLVGIPIRRSKVMATSSTIPSTPTPENAVIIGTVVRGLLFAFGPALAT